MDAVSGNKSFTINEWRVEPALNRLSRADELIKIDPQNMKVLELLASRPGEVISQPEIEQVAWSGVVVTPNSVYQSIAQLRRALGDDKANPRYIETIARKGYRLVAEVDAPSCPLQETGAATGSSAYPLSRIAIRRGTFAALAIMFSVAIVHMQISNDSDSSTIPTHTVPGLVQYGSQPESLGHRRSGCSAWVMPP